MNGVLRLRLVPGLLALALGPPACRCSERERDSPRSGEAGICLQKGTVYVADHIASSEEPQHLRAVHGGCEPCPEALGSGAPVAAPCQSHLVCAEACCRCPNRTRNFTVAACIAGSCAPANAACSVALERYGAELCGD
jgi:hypothetical protein